MEYAKNKFVDETEFKSMIVSIATDTKDVLYKKIQNIIYSGQIKDIMGPGSKEHKSVIVDTAHFLGLKEGKDKVSTGKIISNFADKINKWDSQCYSMGDTITLRGYIELYISLWCFINSNSNLKNNYHDVTIQPEMQIYSIFKTIDYTIPKALSEFIDNSIASYENSILPKGGGVAPLNIAISISNETPGSQIISISDDAAGIAQSDLKSALAVGNFKQNMGLNVYGMGLKFAAFWWVDKFDILTHSSNPISTVDVNVRILQKHPTINVKANGTFQNERSRISANFSRNTGTTIKLYATKSVFDFGELNTYRFISKQDFHAIVAELSEIYSDYLGNTGYSSPSGRKVKIKIEMMYTDSSSGKKNTQRVELKQHKTNILYKPFWPAKHTLPATNTPTLWSENICIAYKGKKVNCLLYMMEEQRRELATIKILYRGKSISGYTFIVKDPDRPTPKPIYGGIPNNPKEIVGQIGSSTSNFIRGHIDLTDFGKTMDGKNIIISKEDLLEIYKEISKVFRTKDLFKMTKNFTNKPKIQSSTQPSNGSNPSIVPVSPISSAPVKSQSGQVELPSAAIYDNQFNEAYSTYQESGILKYIFDEIIIIFVNSSEIRSIISFNSREGNVFSFKVNDAYTLSDAKSAEADKILLMILIVGVITSTKSFYQANIDSLLRLVIELRR